MNTKWENFKDTYSVERRKKGAKILGVSLDRFDLLSENFVETQLREDQKRAQRARKFWEPKIPTQPKVKVKPIFSECTRCNGNKRYNRFYCSQCLTTLETGYRFSSEIPRKSK